MQDQDLAGATIVFDLDGTLVDTAPDLIRALNATLDLEGLPRCAPDTVRALVGQGARALIERGAALSGARFEPRKLDALTEAFIGFYRADIAGGSRPFPGAEAALDALAAAGARLAVCTNKRTDLSVALLDALNLSARFAAIVGADAVRERKPHPGHFLETVARAGGDPGRALMVGDSEADVAAAQAAGAPVAAVRFGYGPDPVESLGADAVLETYAHLPALARRFLAPA